MILSILPILVLIAIFPESEPSSKQPVQTRSVTGKKATPPLKVQAPSHAGFGTPAAPRRNIWH